MSNTVHEDYLNEDPDIPGQKFCLLSFLSPENVLKKKENYFFSQFLSQFELTLKSQLIESHFASKIQSINSALETKACEFEKSDLSGVAQECRNSKIRIDTYVSDLHDFIKKESKLLTEDSLKSKYDDFIFNNSAKLEDEFYKINDFCTTVRGVKIRGTYNSHDEAVARSKKLQRIDTLHNIFVGEVGKWLPWDPEPSKIKEQEYAEDELNTLMKKYKENEEAKEEHHRERREHMRGGANIPSSMFTGDKDLALERKINNQ